MQDKTKEFIDKAILVHGDKYDYSKVEYKKAIEKVIIICNEHGEYLQQPSNHLQGNGCLKCSATKRNNNSRYTTDTFITKANDIHGNIYDYSLVNYVDSKIKVIIICKKHDIFEQAPNKHLQKQGCSKCNCYEKSNNENFINKSKNIHGDKYNYSKVNYVNSQTKVVIICKLHGEFEQIPNSHLQGSGCLKCSNCHKRTSNEFIEKAINLHGNKYDYSKVNYNNATEKVIIICKYHGEFYQTPSDHLTSKYGCNICSSLIRNKNKVNNYSQKFIENAIKVHGNKYDYSKSIYTGCENKLIIICKTHGEFEQQPNNHLYGKGCYECARITINNSRRSNTQDFIIKANDIHGYNYDYSNVQYINNHDKVKIICNIHGEFEQSPSHHLNGQGCSKCGDIKTANSKMYTINEFIEKSIIIHGNKFDYSKVNYVDSKTKIIIICNDHGDFKVKPNNHLSCYQGCPKCQTKKQYSKQQIQWLNFIQTKDNICIQHADNSNEYLIQNLKQMDIVKKLIQFMNIMEIIGMEIHIGLIVMKLIKQLNAHLGNYIKIH